MKKLTRIRLDAFLKQYASEAHTLDLGCANSPYSVLFPNRVGLDVVEGRGVDVVGDAHALPFPDETFERILCTEVLEHLHTPAVAIAEMQRVLKKGGTLILTTRFVFPIHDAPHDYYRYTRFGLEHLFAGWHIETLTEEMGTGDTLATLLQRITIQCTLRGGRMTKGALYLLMYLVRTVLKWCIKSEYGNAHASGTSMSIMTTGYYLVCTKNSRLPQVRAGDRGRMSLS